MAVTTFMQMRQIPHITIDDSFKSELVVAQFVLASLHPKKSLVTAMFVAVFVKLHRLRGTIYNVLNYHEQMFASREYCRYLDFAVSIIVIIEDTLQVVRSITGLVVIIA